jgi:hypothetical protein
MERISNFGSDGIGVFMGVLAMEVFKKMDTTNFGPFLLQQLRFNDGFWHAISLSPGPSEIVLLLLALLVKTKSS